MHEYVSLLRGINVGGKVLRMDRVVELFDLLGLRQARSYIQSGNILFNAGDVRLPELEIEVQRSLRERLSVDATVIIRSRWQLRGIVDANPYGPDPDFDPKSLYVTFLSRAPEGAWPARGENAIDEYRIAGAEVYVLCPGGYGKTAYSNGFFEKQLGVRATTRNWNTVNRLLAIAEARE